MFKSVSATAKRVQFAQIQGLQQTLVSKKWHSQNTQQQQQQQTKHTKKYKPFGLQNMKNCPKINQGYQAAKLEMPEFIPQDNKSNLSYSIMHELEEPWDHDTVLNTLKKNSLFTWGVKETMLSSAIHITHGEGCYLYDYNGKKYIDWSSQAMCTNLGHTIPNEILNCINKQFSQISHLYGGLTYHEIRSKICNLLSEITPGNINSFLFPSSGAEANEGAIRIVRKYTNKHKILSRYRSYHGGTMGSLSLTGDNRTHETVTHTNGFVKMFDPTPTWFNWDDNNNNSNKGVERALNALHEQILHENPNKIAAIWMESITGTNGWVKAPLKYMQGVRALCDKYDILLVFDEVMAGFGRTGKLFAFEHFEGVMPDIITFAKGVSGAYLPLSGIGVSDKISKHFDTNPLGYGSTYQAHPVSLAAGYSTIKYIIDNKIISHVSRMEMEMYQRMNYLVNESKCKNYIKAGRINGFGCALDIADKNTGDIICNFNDVHPNMMKLKQILLKNGLFTMIRGPIIHCCPPLIANEEDLDYGFTILEKSIIETFGQDEE